MKFEPGCQTQSTVRSEGQDVNDYRSPFRFINSNVVSNDQIVKGLLFNLIQISLKNNLFCLYKRAPNIGLVQGSGAQLMLKYYK